VTTEGVAKKTQFGAVLKGRDSQSRRKGPIKLTVASAAGLNIPAAKDFFRSLLNAREVDEAVLNIGSNEFDAEPVPYVGPLRALRQ